MYKAATSDKSFGTSKLHPNQNSQMYENNESLLTHTQHMREHLCVCVCGWGYYNASSYCSQQTFQMLRSLEITSSTQSQFSTLGLLVDT